jgi:predicted ABC-type ATPase
MHPPRNWGRPPFEPRARVAEAGASPCIYVLAGTNGAGKSSVAGAMFRAVNAEYFNPDEAARQILARNAGTDLTEANSAAWQEGRRLLERAIDERLDFAFETTLGGTTITRLLERAASAGLAVRIWYVGLTDPELHIARVRARVAAGGHDIPETRIRERFDASRRNVIRLLPQLTELRLYDNSADNDPHLGRAPEPLLVLHLDRGRVVRTCDLPRTPAWAKPIVAAALRLAPPRAFRRDPRDSA